MPVIERSLQVGDFMQADEVFSTGNHSKIVPIIRVEDRDLQPGPVAKKARALYMGVGAFLSRVHTVAVST